MLIPGTVSGSYHHWFAYRDRQSVRAEPGDSLIFILQEWCSLGEEMKWRYSPSLICTKSYLQSPWYSSNHSLAWLSMTTEVFLSCGAWILHSHWTLWGYWPEIVSKCHVMLSVTLSRGCLSISRDSPARAKHHAMHQFKNSFAKMVSTSNCSKE